MTQRPTKPATPTPHVPLPDPDEVRQRFEVAMEKVRARKGFYGFLAVVALLATVGIIFVLNLTPTHEPSRYIDIYRRWDDARTKLVVNKSAQRELVELEALLEELRGDPEEGFALWYLALGHYTEAWTGDKATLEERLPHLERASAYLDELQEERFDDFLLAKPHWFTSSGQPPIEGLRHQLDQDLEWVAGNAYEEPKPNPDVVAVLRTSEGDIHLQFYPLLAPEHVKNFLMLAKEGTYNGTAFHYIRKDPDTGTPRGVQGGDPFSFFYNQSLKEEQILRWGKGGVGYDLPPEQARFRINHRRGIVTSQMRDKADWDNGSQFMIVLSADPELDKRYTPFAKVVEGLAVADKLAQHKTASQHPPFKDNYRFTSVGTRDLVVEPAILEKVIVYENGKAAQHGFPLTEDEKSLATVSNKPVAPLMGEALYAGRKLRHVDAEGPIRPGLDIPFPDDVDKDASPEGDRK